MKRGDFNFEVIFAVIVGGMILFLAVYGALKLGDNVRYETDTEIAKKIVVLTNPMQAGFSEGKASKVMFNKEVKMDSLCFPDFEDFGEIRISFTTRSDVGEAWNPPGGETAINNKYIFSDSSEQGKTLYIFSKPFEFPYKVADMIFISTERYCFVDSPEQIKKEISDLKIENIDLTNELMNCSQDSVTVCFGENCDIKVFGSGPVSDPFSEGYVEKNGRKVFYVGNLLYGAIFSSERIYNCNLKRLMYRAGKVGEILIIKGDLMNSRGCNTQIVSDLLAYVPQVKKANIDELLQLNKLGKLLDEKTSLEECNVW